MEVILHEGFHKYELPQVGTKSLTEKERQIVDLLCTRGLLNKQIASELNVTLKNVKARVSNICRKLGVENRLGICIWYYTRREIENGNMNGL